MFGPKLAAEREVSFGGDVLDASNACHVSAGGNGAAVLQRTGNLGQERADWRSVI
jgi:hypothetical protein